MRETKKKKKVEREESKTTETETILDFSTTVMFKNKFIEKLATSTQSIAVQTLSWNEWSTAETLSDCVSRGLPLLFLDTRDRQVPSKAKPPAFESAVNTTNILRRLLARKKRASQAILARRNQKITPEEESASKQESMSTIKGAVAKMTPSVSEKSEKKAKKKSEKKAKKYTFFMPPPDELSRFCTNVANECYKVEDELSNHLREGKMCQGDKCKRWLFPKKVQKSEGAAEWCIDCALKIGDAAVKDGANSTTTGSQRKVGHISSPRATGIDYIDCTGIGCGKTAKPGNKCAIIDGPLVNVLIAIACAQTVC